MSIPTNPIAINSVEVPPRTKPSNYPEPFASRVVGREKRSLGDRSPGDEGTYPDDDLQALLVADKWQFFHKDGTPY